MHCWIESPHSLFCTMYAPFETGVLPNVSQMVVLAPAGPAAATGRTVAAATRVNAVSAARSVRTRTEPGTERPLSFRDVGQDAQRVVWERSHNRQDS